MGDEHRGHEDPPPRYEGAIPILPGPQDREDAARNSERENEAEYKRRNTAIQIGILTTQIFLVVFGIVAILITRNQANTARQSADLAACALRESQRQFQATAKSSQEEFTQTLGQMREQSRAQQGASHAAAIQAGAAKDAVQATRDAMYLEERPWVAIEIVPMNAPSVMIKSTIAIARNTGRIPAVKAHEECCEFETRDANEPVPDYDALHGDIDRHMNEGMRERIRRGTGTLEEARNWIRQTQADHARVMFESKVIPPDKYVSLDNLTEIYPDDHRFHYTVGKFVYKDVLDPTKEHVTKFCVVRVGNSDQWQLCKTGNDMQ